MFGKKSPMVMDEHCMKAGPYSRGNEDVSEDFKEIIIAREHKTISSCMKMFLNFLARLKPSEPKLNLQPGLTLIMPETKARLASHNEA